jgi:hypothetical protein
VWAVRRTGADPNQYRRGRRDPAAYLQKAKGFTVSKLKSSIELLSPLRQRLQGVLARVAEIESRAAEQRANAAKLDVVRAAVEPARAELAAFDADQAAAMSRWAQGQINGRPSSSGARRAELVAAVADAAQDAAAAVIAQEQFMRAAAAEHAPAAPLRIETAEVERLIILEDAEPLLAKLKDAITAAHSLRKQVIAARGAAVNGADLAQFRELAAASAQFANAQAVAESIPVDTDHVTQYHTPRYAVEAAAQVRAIMNTPTNYSSANPVI